MSNQQLRDLENGIEILCKNAIKYNVLHRKIPQVQSSETMA